MADAQRTTQAALIGFGEAGAAFAAGWGDGRADVLRAVDIKTQTPVLGAP